MSTAERRCINLAVLAFLIGLVLLGIGIGLILGN